MNRYFKPVLEKAGLPRDTHFHALRHTFATSLLRRGVDVKKVSAWLGHKDAGFTYRVYHHHIPEVIDPREAERLNAILFSTCNKKGR
ncbi:MAG: integrase [Clostridia bacterium]|nr:integrase [Clostridia bacterium]